MSVFFFTVWITAFINKLSDWSLNWITYPN